MAPSAAPNPRRDEGPDGHARTTMGPDAPRSRTASKEDLTRLQADPSLAPQFEAAFGAAATQQVLLSMLTPDEKARLQTSEWNNARSDDSSSDETERSSTEAEVSRITAVEDIEHQLHQAKPVLHAAETKAAVQAHRYEANLPGGLAAPGHATPSVVHAQAGSSRPAGDWSELDDLLSPGPATAVTMGASLSVKAVVGASKRRSTNPFGSSDSGSDGDDTIGMDAPGGTPGGALQPSWQA